MSDLPYEAVGLWKRALGPRSKDPYRPLRERLRSNYAMFWRNTRLLVQRIAADFPSLTLHDEAHLAALWRTADTIAGSKYELTPAEAFVFGGAVLLHDAALTVHAYPEGRIGLLNSTEWKDAVAAELERRGEPVSTFNWDSLDDGIRDSALFGVVRKLHAKQAATLADFAVEKDGSRQYLLENNTLRTHYGWIIGQIAASHHWSIEDVQSRLQIQVNAIDDLPEEWTIDPVKLACLLRCADAAQIDQRRAPDFLYALLKLRGISESHWRAQNRLGKPVRYRDDPTALLYTSTKPFPDQDADVWWLAYDLVTIVHRELQSCEKLLRETGRTPFAIKAVRDAEAPTRLKEHIRVEGWTPVSAELKVTDISHLVSTLGGRALYGDDPSIPLRELIQNAADAIRARRMRESGHVGKILIRLEQEPGEDSFWLHVEDDGVGMSERVLTGPLLDFGRSFWKSDLVQSEFPGLRSSGYESIGRFGIGFFSTFMIADTVNVTSRRYDEGSGATRRLEFRRGLALRPILITATESQWSSSWSTRVSIHIRSEILDRLLSEPTDFDPSEKDIISFTLAQRIARLSPALDADIDVLDQRTGESVSAHSMHWASQPSSKWLEQILVPESFLTGNASISAPGTPEDNLVNERKHQHVDLVIAEAAPHIELLYEGTRVVGRAAIVAPQARYGSSGFPEFYAGMLAVGGLAAPRSFRGILTSFERFGEQFSAVAEAFVGVLHTSCEGAVRAGGRPLAMPETLASWATRQAHLIAVSDIPGERKVLAIKNVLAFHGDASPLFHIVAVKPNTQEAWNTTSYRQEKTLMSRGDFSQFVSDENIICFASVMRNSNHNTGRFTGMFSDFASLQSELLKRFSDRQIDLVLRDSFHNLSLGHIPHPTELAAVFIAPELQYGLKGELRPDLSISMDEGKSEWIRLIIAAWQCVPKVEVVCKGPSDEIFVFLSRTSS